MSPPDPSPPIQSIAKKTNGLQKKLTDCKNRWFLPKDGSVPQEPKKKKRVLESPLTASFAQHKPELPDPFCVWIFQRFLQSVVEQVKSYRIYLFYVGFLTGQPSECPLINNAVPISKQ
jgi:hypothetical protein